MSACAARAKNLRHSVDAMIGELLGARYKVIQVLGSGGFGHTYIAEDTQRPGLPRCCIKHLTFKSNDTKVLQQVRRLFQAEAETLEQLGKHDQIPRLLAYFEEQRQFYLVQEYIDGHPLIEELSKGAQLSEAEVLPLLEDVLGILEYVHAQGVIHRDIKPANLIRRRQDGRLVLIDFGAVKLIGNTVAEATGETSLSMPVYTSGYASSEQCLGRPQFASDIYSLGIVGIQALTGMHPSQLPHDYATSEMIWHDRVAVSKELGAVLDKMVRYHFADRYQSAGETLRAVRSMISTAPTLVKPSENMSGDLTVRSTDSTTRRPSEDGQTIPKVQPPAFRLLTRIGLALLGTAAISILVRTVFESPLIPLRAPSPEPTQPTDADAVAPRISSGERLLNQWQLNPQKQAGIEHVAAGRFDQAIAAFQTARQQNPADPETLIYLNNAKIGTNKSYLIVVVAPLESTLDSGLEILRGAAKAQDEINQRGGINGVPLKVAIADDNNQPETAQAIAKSLANTPDVLGVVGHGTSNTSIAAAQIYQERQLVMVAPVGSAVPLSEIGHYIFRTIPSDRQTARVLKDYMLTQLKKRRVAIFYNSTSKYSQSLKEEFKQALDYSGVADYQIVQEIDLARPDFDADDSIAQITQRKADVLMLAADDRVMDKAMRVIESNNRRLPIIGGDSMFTPRLPKTIKEKGVGIVLAVPVNPSGTPFAKESTQLWKQPDLITWRTALTYDAAEALIAAIAIDPSREGIRRTLAAPTFAAPGSTGLVNFQEKGDRQRKPSYVTIAPIPNSQPQRYGFKVF
jgi:eukaryotic-like serine/threonine-protein kinase